jgi:hypothetical protein
MGLMQKCLNQKPSCLLKAVWLLLLQERRIKMRLKKGQFKSVFYYLLTLSLILLSTDAFGATINVPTAAHPTIQAGIDAANTGDTVLVANGTYTGNGNRNIDFGGKAITVKSVGDPESCIIDVEGSGSNPGRGFYFHSSEGRNSVLSGFTITGGYIEYANGNGGGIFIENNSSPTIKNCIIRQNMAHGGGIYSIGAPEISNCIIENNLAGPAYGGIFSKGPAIIKDCIIRDNSAGHGTGGISAGEGTTISNCSIIDNESSDGVGGISASDSVDIVNCTISRNYGEYGLAGGISLSNGNIINSTISDNRNYFAAGGIYSDGSSTIIGCNIFGNMSTTNGGGMIIGGGSPVISKCNIYNNNSYNTGGGISIVNSSPRIENSNIIGNFATQWGSGIYITDKISNPRSEEIVGPSYPDIIYCTVSRNRGDGAIPVIYVSSGSTLTLTNSILWGNLGNSDRNIWIF